MSDTLDRVNLNPNGNGFQRNHQAGGDRRTGNRLHLRHTIEQECQSGKIVILDVVETPIRRQWFSIRHASRTATPALRRSTISSGFADPACSQS
jgi:hypothetical protein